MHKKTIGLILAGGYARRFGGRKALSLLKGKPLLLWVRETIAPLCTEVWLSLRDPKQAEASLKTYFDRVIWDPFPGAGPLSGLLGGLRELAPNEALLVVSCDQPLLQASLLHKLQDIFNTGNYWVVFCLNRKNEPEPLPGVYGKELREHLEKYLCAGRKSFREWLKTLPPEKILGLPFEIWYSLDKKGLSFLNINFRKDLEEVERILH